MKTKEELKREIIYLCDDALGQPDLISKQLKLDKELVIKMLRELVDEGYLFLNNDWYETTSLGKSYLKNCLLENSK